MKKHTFTFTPKFFKSMYLMYVNDFLTISAFADCHNAHNKNVLCELPNEFYESCVNRGRIIHNGANYKYNTLIKTSGYNRAPAMLLKEHSA